MQWRTGATASNREHVVSELVRQALTATARQLAMGRVEVSSTSEIRDDEVLTLEEAARLLKLPLDVVRARADESDLPARRFGGE